MLARLLLAIGLFFLSCSALFSATQTLAPMSRATAQVQQSCDSVADPLGQSLSEPSRIQKVEPFFVFVYKKVGTERRLWAVELLMRPEQGVAPEQLERTLRCHSARRTLGQLLSAPNDPFVLPGGWVAINVRSERAGFRVRLRGDSREQTERVLRRASAFIDR